jgi:hypothetical protein
MLAAADAPIDASSQAVLFYGWTDDARGLHAELAAATIDVGEIEHPFSCVPARSRWSTRADTSSSSASSTLRRRPPVELRPRS